MTLPLHVVPTLAGVRVGDHVTVEGDEAHHAVAVRRLRVGESVVLTDGAGASLTGEVTSTGKRVFTVQAGSVESEPEPEPRIVVVQALPKGDRGELAVELLTEIGVARVVPWAAARSVAVWKGERVAKGLGRWRSTAREAAKQSRRTWHPEITDLATTDHVVELIRGAALAVVLHEEAVEPLVVVPVPPEGSVVVVVGPEGGLIAEEVAAFVAAGAHAVRLGDEVLRTSTAGLAAVGAVLARTPRWGHL